MPTPDKPTGTVSDELSSAEGRINRGEMDVDVGTKMQIMNLDGSIRGAIQSYKQMGIYEGVSSNFVDLQANDSHTPEALLNNIAFQFRRLEAGEGESAKAQIEAVTAMAVEHLEELKKELTYAAGEEVRVAQKAEQVYQSYLPEYQFDPSNVSQTLVSIGELLGQKPNVEKLQGFELENDSLMAELRRSENTSAYLKAQSQFGTFTSIPLEGLKTKVSESLKTIGDSLKDGVTTEKRGRFAKTFAAAVDSFKLANEVMSAALFFPEEIHTPEEAHEELESHGDLLSEEEMQAMLNIMMNGVQDKNYFQQLFDAKGALDVYAGGEVDLNALSPVERQMFALVNGVGKGSAAFFSFFTHPVDALAHIGAAAGALIKPATYQQIAQMTKYTWDNTDALEKNRLVGDLMGQLLGGFALGAAGGAVLKSKFVAESSAKMGRVARLTGLPQAASTLARLANPILASLPALARYGAAAGEITQGLLGRAAGLGHKWDHMLHNAHSIHSKIDFAEAVTANTAGIAHAAHANLEVPSLPKNLPIYAEIASIKEDFGLALGHAKELGMKPDDVYALRAALKQLNSIAV